MYTYIDVDGTKNVAYNIPTTDINGVYITPIITEVKSDYKADDLCSKADDPGNKADENNNDKQPSATETIDPNTRQPYENVEFDGSNNEDEIYMTPISESTTD